MANLGLTPFSGVPNRATWQMGGGAQAPQADPYSGGFGTGMPQMFPPSTAQAGWTNGGAGGAQAPQAAQAAQANPYAPQMPPMNGAPSGASAPQMPGSSYLDGVNGITRAVNNNLQTNILPGIDSGAVAAGGYGGSRQAQAQGAAIGQSQAQLGSALAQYNLGLGQLGVQNQGQQNNFYTQNRQLDQSGAQLGANLYGQGTQGALSQGQGVYNVGQTQQQAPWTALGNAGGIYNPYTGLGGSSTQTQNGSTLGAITGGALLGSQIIGNLGLGTNMTQKSPNGAYDPSSPNYIPPWNPAFTGPVGG